MFSSQGLIFCMLLLLLIKVAALDFLRSSLVAYDGNSLSCRCGFRALIRYSCLSTGLLSHSSQYCFQEEKLLAPKEKINAIVKRLFSSRCNRELMSCIELEKVQYRLCMRGCFSWDYRNQHDKTNNYSSIRAC